MFSGKSPWWFAYLCGDLGVFPDLVIKSDCPSCGKEKALTNQVWFIKGGGALLKTKGNGCYKCGHCPPTREAK